MRHRILRAFAVRGLTCPALNSLLDPVDRISDYFIPAVFIKDLMEESSVNFHLFIFGRCLSKEIISIFYTYETVFSP